MLRRIEQERQICKYMNIQCLIPRKLQGNIHRSMNFLRGAILTLDKTHKPSGRRSVSSDILDGIPLCSDIYDA